MSQVQNLKRTLEEEARQIKSIERDLIRKQADYRRAKELFEKVDKEIQELNKKKTDLIQRHATLENELRNIQKEIEQDLKKHETSSLKY